MRLSKRYVAERMNLRPWQVVSITEVDDETIRVSVKTTYKSEPVSFEIDCLSDPWMPVMVKN